MNIALKRDRIKLFTKGCIWYFNSLTIPYSSFFQKRGEDIGKIEKFKKGLTKKSSDTKRIENKRSNNRSRLSLWNDPSLVFFKLIFRCFFVKTGKEGN